MRPIPDGYHVIAVTSALTTPLGLLFAPANVSFLCAGWVRRVSCRWVARKSLLPRLPTGIRTLALHKIGCHAKMLQYLQQAPSILRLGTQRILSLDLEECNMAFWRTKANQAYAEMAAQLAAQPGVTPAELARKLGVPTSTITRRLPSLEEAGILLYEDEQGRLWPYGDPSAER